MLSPYKTPSARVGVYPNVMPALNFSKIYLRQARQWKINHSLNKPFQESAQMEVIWLAACSQNLQCHVANGINISSLSLFSLTFIPLLIDSTFHSGAQASFVWMRMFPLLGRGIANGPSLVDQKERGAPSSGLSQSHCRDQAYPLAEMLLPCWTLFFCHPCALSLF